MAHQAETGNEARTEQNAAPAAVVELNASAAAAPVVDIETARQQGINQERTIFFKTYTEKVWGIPTSELSADWAAQRIKGLPYQKQS